VLGTQWLATLGPLLWDFGQLTLQFWRGSQAVCWHEITGSAGPRFHGTTDRDLLDAILTEFHQIFAEPTSLPLLRTHDHHITLLHGAAPVAVRPYKYPSAHKHELEHQCQALLQ
jgi:hypothetical protein